MTDKDLSAPVVVIGGGPAGMMAAGTAAQRGRSVLLLEKNGITGKKLNLTGKGRCNVTNLCTAEEVLSSVLRNPRFLYSACTGFSPADTMEFFASIGLKLKTERGSRVFPESDRAADVSAALRGYMKKGGVRIEKARVTGIRTEGGRVAGVTTQGGFIPCQSAVIATGGLSYPSTGSTGDGYRLAEQCGHKIVTPRPSLVPLVAKQEFCGRMQGLSLRNVAVRVVDRDGKTVYRDFGEMLFTHFGVSGPVVLSASAHMEGGGYRIVIDLKPALDEKKLDLRLLRDFRKYENREFQNSLADLLHKTMIPVIIDLSGIPPRTKVNSISREQRKSLCALLKNLCVDIAGTRPIEEAVVTAGGVDVSGIDPKTMESKYTKGLYFAGEVMDVDAYTGGFNLQIAWSTGRAAGGAV